jgi:hypothetical protein
MELDSCRKLERKDVCEQGVYNCGKVRSSFMSMRPLWGLLIATHRICFASDTDVYVTQSARCSNAVPKLFFSNDSGKTFTRIAGPMDYNPAAFVDYRDLVAAPIGLVVNCFVCYHFARWWVPQCHIFHSHQHCEWPFHNAVRAKRAQISHHKHVQGR